MSNKQKLYFSAGPARIPTEVMDLAHKEFLNYRDTGISVLEMSHRSKEFLRIMDETESDLRHLLKIPDNYAVLFLQGGAKTQFSGVPLNLCKDRSVKVDYVINGSWSKLAATEAERYASTTKQSILKFDHVPRANELINVEGARYRYYCDNETIEGVEFDYVPQANNDSVLVSDMTSNFLSRPVDIQKFGVIFASAQKNCGIAGLLIAIVRRDLMGNPSSYCPKTLNYKVMDDNKSCYNTPQTFAIYMAGICFRWIRDQGGLEAMDKFSRSKSSLLYNYIDKSNGYYVSPVQKSSRSRMNVVWLLGDQSLESTFLEESKKANIFDIKGHRTVGGFRASLYHGITLPMVEILIEFMEKFKKEHPW